MNDSSPVKLYSNCVNLSTYNFEGLGLNNNTKNKIDTNGFIQFDLADIIRLKSLKCEEPKITLTIQANSCFEILGSSILSSPGIQLYTCSNNGSTQIELTIVIPSYSDEFPQLSLYGMVPYRYISVRALNGLVIVSKISFSYLKCSSDED